MRDNEQVDEVVRALIATMTSVADRADLLLAAARRCADVIARGGTLWVDAGDARRPHADHVAVEFVHPVITGKRAVPALVVDSNAHAMVGANDGRVWMGPGSDHSTALRSTPTIDLAEIGDALDERFSDVGVVLVHHLLWEITHAVLERSPADDYLAALDTSTRHGPTIGDIVDKVTTSTTTVATTATRHATVIATLANAIGDARPARRIWVIGQGGSAADAALAAARLRGTCLSTNPAVLTALVNDIGPESMYARQVATHVGNDDIVLALTTSGASRPVVAALAAADSIGACTVACTGAAGLVDAPAECASRTIVLDVASDSIHRIQETHLAIVAVLAAKAARS